VRYPPGKEGERYEIPDIILTIVAHAFRNNSFLKEIVVHADVRDGRSFLQSWEYLHGIGSGAFANLPNLTRIDFLRERNYNDLGNGELFGDASPELTVYGFAVNTELASRCRVDGVRFVAFENENEPIVNTWNIGEPNAESVTATLNDEGVLTISGTGNMRRLEGNDNPWRFRGVKHVVVNNGVTNVGRDAFLGMSSVETISISASVTSFSVDLSRTTGLTQITADGNNPNFTSIDGVLFNKAGSNIIHYPLAKAGAQYTIPESMTEVNLDRFDNSRVRSIVVPATVTRFFGEGNTITEIIVNENNPNFSSEDGILFNKAGNELLRFPRRKNLKYYLIPENVTTVASRAFGNSDFLEQIDIPATVTSFGTLNRNMPAIQRVEILPRTTVLNWEGGYFDGVLFSDLTTQLAGRYQLSTTVTRDTILPVQRFCEVYRVRFMTRDGKLQVGNPNAADVVAQMSGENLVFSGTGNMRSWGSAPRGEQPAPWHDFLARRIRRVIIENGVTSIGRNAFENHGYGWTDDNIYQNLEELVINATLAVPDSAFFNHFALKKIVLGDNVTRIGDRAFAKSGWSERERSTLEEVVIGSGVTVIDALAFINNPKLRRVEFRRVSGNINIESRAFNFDDANVGSPTPGMVFYGYSTNTSVVNFAATRNIPFFPLDVGMVQWNVGSPNEASITARLNADGILTISGTGAMMNWTNRWGDSNRRAPWYGFIKQIKELIKTLLLIFK
jgi:hypothetical protein